MNPIALALRFIGLLALQVLVLDRLVLHGFLTPYIYVWMVLALPITFPTWASLLIGFATGLAVDFFLNTGGIHALSMVCLAYTRPLIIRMLAPPEGYEPDDRPSIPSMGLGWFLAYATIGVLYHHFIYFAVEILSFSYLLYFIKKWLITALATLIFLVIVQMFGWRRK